MKKYKIYLGWDSRETLAYNVAEHSILRRTDPNDVHITPLKLKFLNHILTRPIEHKNGKLWCPISQAHMATEFAISRFCVPFLQKKGWALFADSDIIVLDDIRKLFDLADPKYAVQVVKHQQENNGVTTKMDGQVQTYYNRKNWSSVILWNLDHPAHKWLTLEHLNTWPGRDLHAFKWLDDGEIGELPLGWNFLVNVTPTIPDPISLLHFTLGGPWIPNWEPKQFDDIWNNEWQALTDAQNAA